MKYLLLTGVIGFGLSGVGASIARAADQLSSPLTPNVAAPTLAATSQGSGTALAEVVVTASRRETSILKTPTAVSAYGGTQLKQAQIASLTDLATLTPNLQIGTWGTQTNISLRGIGNTNVTAAGADPGVAVSEDGVYLSESGLMLSSFLDVSRVEILRGPQGTLFGRNATGGAIDVIPNTPTRDFHYGADVTLGADPTLVRSSGFISGPLTADGELQGRLAVQQNYDSGYTKDLAASGPQGLDGVNAYGARAQLQWEPNSIFKTRLLVEYQGEKDSGPAQYDVGTPDPTIPLPLPLQGAPGAQNTDLGGRKTYANYGVRQMNSVMANLTTDVALGGGNLRALLSYNSADEYTHTDGDGTPVDFTSTNYTDHAHQYFAELLYTSDPSKRLTYVAGANYFQSQEFNHIVVPISTFPMAVSEGGTLDTTSYAIFGQATYKIVQGLKAYAGARYTMDQKSIDNEFNDYAPPFFIQRRSASWSRLTYEGGLSYDFSRSVSGYVKYATGYKGGGYSVGALAPPFAPETNTNVEVGLKGTYLNGTLQANLAAFHMEYNNLQVDQVVGFSSTVTNAARATIDGVEIESVLRPIDHLRLNLSGGWLNARFNQFVTEDSARPSLGLLNLAGNELPQAPRFNASIGAYYDVPVPSGTVTFGGRYDWKSKVYFNEFNIPVSSQGAAGKLDLSLVYEDGPGHWTASLFAKNVTDVTIKSNTIVVSAVLGSLAIVQLQPGRQVGVSIGYKF